MTTTYAGTVTGEALPWDLGHKAGTEPTLHLVVAWALDEPERVGESCSLASPITIGRGEAQPGDRYPRARWYKRHSGYGDEERPLASRRISRSQLECTPLEKGRVKIRSVGQCALLFGGRPVEEATVGRGDVVVLKNAAIFVVAEKRITAGPESSERFPFGEPDDDGIIGESLAIELLRSRLVLAAESSHHVLVTGASGTGKELCARAIHRRGTRRQGPFVARNATTIPEGIVDAELFGCAKGYPNSGSPERTGLIGEADGGTLFLDEIGELSHGVQAHLLRVLDEGGEYQRLGETKSRRSDFRAVAATNRPLVQLKHDFGARFTSRIETPSLNDRREDIPLLALGILRRFAKESPRLLAAFRLEIGGKTFFRLDPALVEALLSHEFETHLRELERILWHGIEGSQGEFIGLTNDFETRGSAPPPEEGARESRVPNSGDELGRDDVLTALERAKGSVTAAARALGLKNRYVLYRVMKRHGISGEGDGDAEAVEETS